MWDANLRFATLQGREVILPKSDILLHVIYVCYTA